MWGEPRSLRLGDLEILSYCLFYGFGLLRSAFPPQQASGKPGDGSNDGRQPEPFLGFQLVCPFVVYNRLRCLVPREETYAVFRRPAAAVFRADFFDEDSRCATRFGPLKAFPGLCCLVAAPCWRTFVARTLLALLIRDIPFSSCAGCCSDDAGSRLRVRSPATPVPPTLHAPIPRRVVSERVPAPHHPLALCFGYWDAPLGGVVPEPGIRLP